MATRDLKGELMVISGRKSGQDRRGRVLWRGYDLYEGQEDVKPYGGNRSGPIFILTHGPSPCRTTTWGSRSSRTTSSAPWPLPSKPPRARMSSCSDPRSR